MDEQEQKKDLIDSAKQLPKPEAFSLRPRTFEEAYRFANLMSESDLIPREFQKKPANVLVAVQLGMELGVAPMQAIQNIAVINGRPVIWGDLLPAIVLASGIMEQFEETGDDKEARCTVKRKNLAPITRVFTIEEAKKAGLIDRSDAWKKYPKRMLQMRARAFAFRDMFADLLKGVSIREEVEDYDDNPRDVTPQRVQLPHVDLPQKISDKKRKDFYVMCVNRGLSDEKIGEKLASYGYGSTVDIKDDHFDELWKWASEFAVQPVETKNPDDQDNLPFDKWSKQAETT